MKYIKYPSNNSIQKRLYKERVNNLYTNEKRNYKLHRVLGKSSFVLFLLLTTIFIILGIHVSRMDGLNGIVMALLLILIVLLALILPSLITGIIYTAISKKIPYCSLPSITRKLITKCNQPLFQFYKIPNYYIITKCYDCYRQNFINKDIMLFFHEDKIRITVDYTGTVKDLGCYEFNLEEIELSYEQRGHILAAVLKTKDLYFVLGRRAKPYILKRKMN